MKRIIKGNAPDFWTSFVRKNPKVTYKDLDRTKGGPEVRAQLRTHLAYEQGNVCCYCCSILLQEKSHNEHIKPESVYTRLTMDYNNIIVSCTQKQHCDNSSCGMEKDRDYDERLFVSPLEDDCAKHFIFNPDGSIDSDTERGKYTMQLLRLDESKSLKVNRRKQYEAVYNFCSSEVADLCEGISDDNGEEYALAKELYQTFFNEAVVPEYFSISDGQFPAYIDMLEYFKDQGYFDFDSIVSDLTISGCLKFGSERFLLEEIPV